MNTPCNLRSLGVGKDKRVILSSICLVIISFFYFFVVGSVLETKIYTFHYRVTYESIFGTHITDLNIDTFILLSATVAWLYLCLKAGYRKSAIIIFFLIFLALLFLNNNTVTHVGAAFTLPFVSCLIVIDSFNSRKMLKHDRNLSLDYLIIASIGLAILGIISILTFVSTGVPTDSIERYSYAIYQQLSSILTPILMAALVFCVPLKVLLAQSSNRIKMKSESLSQATFENKLSTKRVAIYLSLCAMIGVSIALIPHVSVVNPNSERLGVDTPRYVTWLTLMDNQSVSPIGFALKSAGDRPLTLLILFLITEVTNADPFMVIEFSPIILAPLLILVTFFLTRELTANDKIAIVASFLSAISFQTLIGMYSGFYANWLALVFGYSAFTLLVRCLKRPSKFRLVALGLLMAGLLFAHTYTWTIMISVAFVFLFVLHALNYYPRKHFILLYLILASSIAVDVLKSTWTGSLSGIEADVSIGFGHGLGISQFSERLGTLAETVQTYYGGVYANIAILGLVMYWLIRCQPRELANIFILIFLSTALIPLFIGDFLLQSRILYDIPFQIPAAISIYYIESKNGKMMITALLLIMVYLSLHIVANLGYVPPPPPS